MLTMQGTNIGGERVVGADRYRWFYENQTPISVSYVWLCRYSDRIRWPPSIHFLWARLGLNQRPLACEASALPLSYAPGTDRILRARVQARTKPQAV